MVHEAVNSKKKTEFLDIFENYRYYTDIFRTEVKP